jgi:predicted SPOUT superfamily RNA methylase MTH1
MSVLSEAADRYVGADLQCEARVWDRGEYIGDGIVDELLAFAEAANFHRLSFRLKENSPKEVVVQMRGPRDLYNGFFVNLERDLSSDWFKKHGMDNLARAKSVRVSGDTLTFSY